MSRACRAIHLSRPVGFSLALNPRALKSTIVVASPWSKNSESAPTRNHRSLLIDASFADIQPLSRSGGHGSGGLREGQDQYSDSGDNGISRQEPIASLRFAQFTAFQQQTGVRVP